MFERSVEMNVFFHCALNNYLIPAFKFGLTDWAINKKGGTILDVYTLYLDLNKGDIYVNYYCLT